MRTELIGHELYKLIRSPVPWALAVLFLALNFTVMATAPAFERREEMKAVNEMVREYGYDLNGEAYRGLKRAHAADNAGGPTTETGYREQLEAYAVLTDIDALYAGIDLPAYGRAIAYQAGLSGRAAEWLIAQYERLDSRFQQLRANGEHETLFFPGTMFGTHPLLFKTVFGFLLFECLVLTLLLTAALAKYEFEHRTYLVVYAAGRGRRLTADKLAAALIATAVITVVMTALTLGLYFRLYDYSNMWDVPISSYFHFTGLEKLPYISWHSLSFGQYLALEAGAMLALLLLFCAIAFILSVHMTNSYVVFAAFALLTGLSLLLPGWIPGSSPLRLIAGFNPFILVLHFDRLLMEAGSLTFRHYERILFAVWTPLLALGLYASLKRFYRQNI